MQTALWRCAGVDSAQVSRVANRYGVPTRVARWLLGRMESEDDVSDVLNPGGISWTSPYLFDDMGVAVSHIGGCIRRAERIAIIGDYDVDGVTATAILAAALDQFNTDYVCLIPHRVEDGYGLTTALVERAHAAGAKTVITVDNGIHCVEAVRHASELGIAVVVTDHHEPGNGQPPDAIAIVHWCRSASADLRHLSGAGVAWKLALALTKDGSAARDSDFLAWIQALACLGAMADMMPMVGENRRLVQDGIRALRTVSRPGWKALCDIAGVEVDKLSATNLLWAVTPRINAAGRMGHAELALDLLSATDSSGAAQAAAVIEELNQLRRKETERAAAEAVLKLNSGLQPTDLPPVLVIAGDWPLGVVGIVAAKLTDHFGRPAIVFADDGGEVLRGSGRAASGVPLHRWVSACKEFLEHFGGHETALGCGVQRSKLDAFRDALCRVATQDAVLPPQSDRQLQAAEMDIQPLADDYLPLSDVQVDVARWISKLAPFGTAFPAYEFYVGPVSLMSVKAMGQGRHLRITVQEGQDSRELVWFNPPAWAFELQIGTRLSVISSLELNEWRGVERAQLRVKDAFVLERPLLREDFAVAYRLLKARRKVRCDELSRKLPEWDPLYVQTVFDTFVDLGFAYVEETAYHVVEQVESRDLRDSVVYQTHLAASLRPGNRER